MSSVVRLILGGLLVLVVAGSAFGQDCPWQAAAPTPVSWELRGVAYFQGRFYAAGSFRVDAFNLEPLIVASPNGRDWVTVFHPEESGSLSSIATDGSRLVAVGGTRIVSSSNGLNWGSLDVGAPVLAEVEWLGDKFYAVGDENRILFSSTGFSWSSASVDASCSTCALTSVARKGSTYVAAVLEIGRVLVSQDGTNWSQASAVSGEPFQDIASNGSIFLGLGRGGNSGLSFDGVAWDDIDPPTLADVYHVRWDGSSFRAFGEDGLIMKSPEGLSWTFEFSPTEVDLRGAAFHGTSAVAVGSLSFPSASPEDRRIIFQDCSSSGLPDLTVFTGSEKSVLSPGEEFVMISSVSNRGDVASDSTVLRFLLSSDGLITPSDTVLATAAVPVVEPGLPANIQRTANAPGAGSFFLGACVDPVAGESDVSNNCSLAFGLTVCGFSISPMGRNHSSSGGSATIDVNVNSGACSWTASESLSWVTITSGPSGAGPGTVTYSVAPNNSASARSGVITIAGQGFSVTQAGLSCTVSLSPTTRTHPASGGTGSISVTADPGCPWTAAEDLAWVNIDSGETGEGNGIVNYSVSAHDRANSRVGLITVAGEEFRVRQEGAECNYSVSPSSRTHSASPGQGEIVVDTILGCPWTASEGLPWISLSASEGAGSSAITYFLSENTTASARSGTITVAGQGVGVAQLGRGQQPTGDVFYVPLIAHGRAGDNEFSTAINLLNLGSTTSQVSIEAYDDNGFPSSILRSGILVTDQVTVPVGLHGTASISTASSNPDQLKTGWALIRPLQEVAVQVVFRIADQRTAALQTAANVRAGELTTEGWTFAIANSTVDTGVAMLNPPDNEVVADVALTLRDSTGNALGFTALSLVPGQKTAAFVTELLGISGVVGSLEIRSSVPIAMLPLKQEGFVLTTQDMFPSR